MREYGQLQTSFWSDPDIRSLSDQGKLLAVYLIEGPHTNGIGCFRLPSGYVESDLGWSSETVSQGFEELFRIGLTRRCEATDYVFLPKFVRWNLISNGNVATARQREFETLSKKISFYSDLARALLDHGRHWSKGFETLLRTLSEGYAKQDPTQPHPDPTLPRSDLSSNADASDATDSDPPPGLFAEFWTAYPKREAKPPAERAFRRLSAADQRAAIDGIARWLDSGRWDDRRYVPQPATYLNQRRWVDEIVPAATAPRTSDRGRFETAFERVQRLNADPDPQPDDGRTIEGHATPVGTALRGVRG